MTGPTAGTGPTGSTGPTGLGTSGGTGPTGTSIYSGTGAPSFTGSAGDSYLNTSNGSIYRFSYTNAITTVAGSYSARNTFAGDGGAATSAGMYNPANIAFDSANNLYICDYNNNRVRKVTNTTGIISTVPTPSVTLNKPADIKFDSLDNLYIAEADGQRIRLVTASTGVVSILAGTGSSGSSGDGGLATLATFSNPRGIALDSAGNIYIADWGNHVVRKITVSTGIITRFAGTLSTSGYSGDGGAATSARISYPWGVNIDSANNLYIAEWGNHVIRKVILSTGVISTVAGIGTQNGYTGDGGLATSAKLANPRGCVVDTAGNIYIADTVNNVIRYVAASTGIITTIAGTTVAGYSGDGGLPTSAQINGPEGVGISKTGELHIADGGNSVIRKIYVNTSSGAWSITGSILGPTGPTGGVGSAYTPATAGNWTGTAPTTIQSALDRIAASLVSLSRYP